MPLPPEKRAEYEAAVRYLYRLMLECLAELRAEGLLEEPSQVNTTPEPERVVQKSTHRAPLAEGETQTLEM